MLLFEPLPLSLAPTFPSNAEFQANATTITVASFTNPDVGIDADGDLVVVWQDDSGFSSDIKFRRFSATGTPIDTTDRIVVNALFTDETEPAIAVAPDGRFVVAYVKTNNIFVRRFASDGTALGVEIPVSESQADSNNINSAPDIAIDADGDFAVVWTHEFEEGDLDIRGAWFNSDGTVITNDTEIAISGESDPAIAMIQAENNSNPNTDLATVVSWTSNNSGNNDIFFRRFGNEGNTLGDPENAVSSVNQAQDQSESSIAIDLQGNFAIAWTHEFAAGNDDIHFRRFNPDGTPVDTTEIVVDNPTGNQNEPVIAVSGTLSGDGSGDSQFVIAYEDDVDESVKFRQFNSDGNPLGNAESYGVNSNDADNPAIAINDHNNLVIVADDDQANLNDPFARVFGVTSTDTGPITLTGGTAQIAYVAYYGRPADNGGQAFWNERLTTFGVSYSPRNGDFLTGSELAIYNEIINDFGNTAESNRLFGSLTNEQRVNLVYNHAFNRDAEAAGLAFWTERLDVGDATLATFALQIALGAQNQDIITLRNKIESADRFSTSIDTTAEVNAYVGGTAELFGRNWLDDFGLTVAPQANVDAALAELVS